jgi:hypothetical protein
MLTLIQTEAFRTGVVCVVLAVLSGIVTASLILGVRRMRATQADARKVHLQLANIVQMLLRAGFRPAKGRLDWHDHGHETQVMGEGSPYDTKVDPFAAWRAKS